MGRYDFKPLRVYQRATNQIGTPLQRSKPSWYDVIGSVPPTQALVRTLPVQHRERAQRPRVKKASKMFKPQALGYEEDALRQEFFVDHPWELARPRIVLENDGKDGQRNDWSKIQQLGRRVDGESVVQRQLWLRTHAKLSSAEAYDQARQEFYEIRHQEDVERRVAKEEALATGAYFGKSALEIGMELEDKSWENWKAWALKESTSISQTREAAYTGNAEDEREDAGLEADVLEDVPTAAAAPT